MLTLVATNESEFWALVWSEIKTEETLLECYTIINKEVGRPQWHSVINIALICINRGPFSTSTWAVSLNMAFWASTLTFKIIYKTVLIEKKGKNVSLYILGYSSSLSSSSSSSSSSLSSISSSSSPSTSSSSSSASASLPLSLSLSLLSSSLSSSSSSLSLSLPLSSSLSSLLSSLLSSSSSSLSFPLSLPLSVS